MITYAQILTVSQLTTQVKSKQILQVHENDNNNQCNSPLYITTWVGWYQKKHN